MAAVEKRSFTYIDLVPTHAKNEKLRPQLEKDLKDELVKAVPAMVSRLAELEPLITREVGEYTNFLMEAESAFQFGLWRGVVALIGIAAENFTDSLYSQVKRVKSVTGKEIAKDKLFGRDDYLPEQRKLEVLRLFGLIGESSYDKPARIKTLRDLYVHPEPKDRDFGQDAREVMALFRAVLKERFDAKYTIKQGKIVERQPDTSNSGLSTANY